MKRVILFTFLILLLAVPSYAQWDSSSSGGGITITTIGSLPAASSKDAGTVYAVTDGANSSDCSSGSGSDHNLCVTNGSSWVIVGDGTGGAGSGSMTTVEVDNVQVGGADIVTLDFGTGFDVAEDPNTEINVTLDLTEIGTSTWGSGSAITWTFNASAGTDSTIAFGDGLITFGHDVKVTGDDLFMNTNTDKYLLVADGTNFNPVESTGDVIIANTGAATIQANAVEESMLKFVDFAADEAIMTSESTTGDFEWHTFDEIVVNMSQGLLPNDSVVEADLKAVDDAYDEDVFTFESTTGDFEWHTIAQLVATLSEGALPNDNILEADLKAVDAASDEDILTYEFTTGDFEWHTTAQMLENISATQGTILYRGAAAWGVLAPGTSGKYLKTQGAAADVMWDTPTGSGDITSVGNCTAGDCFTDGNANDQSLVFEVTDNAHETTLTATDPTADRTVTIPDETGTLVLGPAGFGTDNILVKTNGTGQLTQATGIAVDDSNNMSSIGTISSGAITSTGTSTFGTAASPDASDGAALGSTSAEWSDLYIADGGIIYGQDDQSNTLTTSATDWTFGLDITVSGGNINTGNIAFTVGDNTTDTITLLTDGTGEGEVELPNDSIGDEEIDWSDVTAADITMTDAGAITSSGTITAAVGFDCTGAADCDIGSADILDVTVLENGGTYIFDNGFHASGEDLGSTSAEWNDLFLGDDGVVQFGADQDTTLGYDETTDDRLELTTTLSAATGDEEAFAILYTTNKATSGADTGLLINQTDTASPGTSNLIDAQVGGTSKFSVDNTGKITQAAAADPYWFFNALTTNDTNWTISVDTDQVGDNDDSLKWSADTSETAIQNDTAPQMEMQPDGDFIISGNYTGDALILEGGTYDTTINPGTPTESVTYQWPLSDGTNGQVLTTNSSGTLTWSDKSAASAGGNDTEVQYNSSGTLAGDTGFLWNATNNTLSITQAASNVVIQVGDGTYTWHHNPEIATEGDIEVDGDIFGEDDLYLDSDSAVIHFGEDADITLTHTADSHLTTNGDFVVGGADLTLHSAGVKLTGDGDGAITLLGLGDGADEDLTINLDDTANAVVVSSSTGVTAMSFNTNNIALKAPMEVTAADADGETIATADLNTVRISSGAGDWDLPADSCDAATGNWLTVVANAAHVASITSLDTGDQFVLTDGTVLTADDELDTGGSAWDSCTVMCVATNTWLVIGERGTCADGGVAD